MEECGVEHVRIAGAYAVVSAVGCAPSKIVISSRCLEVEISHCVVSMKQALRQNTFFSKRN